MRNRKFIASLMLASMLASSAMPVYADYSKSGDTGTQEVQSSFDVTANDLGGLLVSIPAEIPLTYNKGSSNYSGKDSIKVAGYLDNDLRVKITTPDTVEYINSSNTLTGSVSFGEENVGYWTSEECKSGVVQKELGITVSDLDTIHTGEYSGTLSVNISVESATDDSELRTFAMKSMQMYEPTPLSAFNHRESRTCYLWLKGLADSGLTLENVYIDSTYDVDIDSVTDTNQVVSHKDGSSTPDFNNNDTIVNLGICNFCTIYQSSPSYNGLTKLKTLEFLPSTPESHYETAGSTSIAKMFANCSALETVGFYQEVNTADNWFEGCTSLKNLILSKSQVKFNETTFDGCTAINNIVYESTIADAKNITIGSKKLDSVDWNNTSDTSSTTYILGHATWHCSDGDYVPADAE